MNFQVIRFEGHEPIVCSGATDEPKRHRHFLGLDPTHPFTTSYHLTYWEAQEAANPSKPKKLAKTEAVTETKKIDNDESSEPIY